jgi:hypothetical protein
VEDSVEVDIAVLWDREEVGIFRRDELMELDNLDINKLFKSIFNSVNKR